MIKKEEKQEINRDIKINKRAETRFNKVLNTETERLGITKLEYSKILHKNPEDLFAFIVKSMPKGVEEAWIKAQLTIIHNNSISEEEGEAQEFVYTQHDYMSIETSSETHRERRRQFISILILLGLMEQVGQGLAGQGRGYSVCEKSGTPYKKLYYVFKTPEISVNTLKGLNNLINGIKKSYTKLKKKITSFTPFDSKSKYIVLNNDTSPAQFTKLISRCYKGFDFIKPFSSGYKTEKTADKKTKYKIDSKGEFIQNTRNAYVGFFKGIKYSVLKSINRDSRKKQTIITTKGFSYNIAEFMHIVMQKPQFLTSKIL